MNNLPTQAPLPAGPAPVDLRPGPPASTGPAPRDGARTGERLLRRQKDGKILAGVCAGLGRYLGLDPILLRVALVVLTLANGIGILVYVIAAIVIPPERPGEPVGPARPADAGLGRLVVGGVLVTAGALLLLDQFVSAAGRMFWPLAVAAIGLAILLKGGPPMSVTQPPRLVDEPRERLPRPPSPPPSRSGFQLVYVVFGLLLVLWGVGWLLDELGVIELATGALLPATLIAIGLVLILDAGHHAHTGLVVLGAVLMVSLAVASTVTDLGVDRDAGTGDRLVRPVSAAQLTEPYEHAVGTLTIDLRSAPLTEGVTTVTARVGIGQLVVQAPPGVPVQVRGRAAVGDVRALGQNRSGVGVDATLTDHTTAGGYGVAPQSLQLDLRVGVGGIEVW